MNEHKVEKILIALFLKKFLSTKKAIRIRTIAREISRSIDLTSKILIEMEEEELLVHKTPGLKKKQKYYYLTEKGLESVKEYEK